MSKSFYCECCKKKFHKGWSEEESLKEKNDLFPEEDIKDMPLVCGACFEKIMIFNNDYRFLKEK